MKSREHLLPFSHFVLLNDLLIKGSKSCTFKSSFSRDVKIKLIPLVQVVFLSKRVMWNFSIFFVCVSALVASQKKRRKKKKRKMKKKKK